MGDYFLEDEGIIVSDSARTARYSCACRCLCKKPARKPALCGACFAHYSIRNYGKHGFEEDWDNL